MISLACFPYLIGAAAAVGGIGTIIYRLCARVHNVAIPTIETQSLAYSHRPATIQTIVDQNYDLNIRFSENFDRTGAPIYQFPLVNENSSHKGKTSTDYISRYLRSKPIARILDIGTGDGTFLLAAQYQFKNRVYMQGITGFDRREDLSLTDDQYLVGNIENILNIPGLETSFDLIFSQLTFCHLKDPLGTLCRAYELLKPGGKIILDQFFVLGISIQQLKQAFQESGYECEIWGTSPLKYIAYVTKLVLKKTKEHLLIPIEYSIESSNQDKVVYQRNDSRR